MSNYFLTPIHRLAKSSIFYNIGRVGLEDSNAQDEPEKKALRSWKLCTFWAIFAPFEQFLQILLTGYWIKLQREKEEAVGCEAIGCEAEVGNEDWRTGMMKHMMKSLILDPIDLKFETQCLLTYLKVLSLFFLVFR